MPNLCDLSRRPCHLEIIWCQDWLERAEVNRGYQSSGAVGKSRWTSWAPVPNKPTVSVDLKQHSNQQRLLSSNTERRRSERVLFVNSSFFSWGLTSTKTTYSPLGTGRKLGQKDSLYWSIHTLAILFSFFSWHWFSNKQSPTWKIPNSKRLQAKLLNK